MKLIPKTRQALLANKAESMADGVKMAAWLFVVL